MAGIQGSNMSLQGKVVTSHSRAVEEMTNMVVAKAKTRPVIVFCTKM